MKQIVLAAPDAHRFASRRVTDEHSILATSKTYFISSYDSMWTHEGNRKHARRDGSVYIWTRGIYTENSFQENNCTRVEFIMSRKTVRREGRLNIQQYAQNYRTQNSIRGIHMPSFIELERCLVAWVLEKLWRYRRRAVLLCHELVLMQKETCQLKSLCVRKGKRKNSILAKIIRVY